MINGRVSAAQFELVEQAAGHLGMTRSKLVATAVAQFITRNNFAKRLPRVEVPADVLAAVRSTQETLDRVIVELRREGNNINQMTRHVRRGNDPAVDRLNQWLSQQATCRTILGQIADDLRTILDRERW